MKTILVPTTHVLAALAFALPQSLPAQPAPSGVYAAPSYANRVNPPNPAGQTFAAPIVRFSELDSKTEDALSEDLNVMALLLEQNLREYISSQSRSYRMGIPMLVTDSTDPVQALYLDGFGVLFVLPVDMLLVAPPDPGKPVEQAKPNSAWEEARQRLYGAPPADNWATLIETRAPVPYNAAEVEAFKKVLLESLKHASNIRGLKADDFVAITAFTTARIQAVASVAFSPDGRRLATVLDPALSQEDQPVEEKQTGKTHDPNQPLHETRPGKAAMLGQRLSKNWDVSTGREIGAPPPSRAVAHRVSALSVRAKKSLVDKFAGGGIPLSEFTSSVQMHTYLSAGFTPADRRNPQNSYRAWTPPR